MVNYINMRSSIQAAADAEGIKSKPRIERPAFNDRQSSGKL